MQDMTGCRSSQGVRSSSRLGVLRYVAAALLVAGVVSGAELDLVPKRVWLRADIGVEAAVDGSVTRWLDQSGNNNHATVATAVKPQWVNADAEWGGRARVRFAGTSNATLPNNCLSGLTAAELIVVARSRAAAGIENGWMRLGQSSGDRFPTAQGAWIDGFGFNAAAATAPIGMVSLTQPVICSVSTQVNDRHVMRINGMELRSAPVPATLTWPTTPVIGQSNIGFTGDIAEIIVVEQRLSDDQRLRIQQEVAARYGIGAPPAPPADVAAVTRGAGTVELAWSHPVAGAMNYRIERSVDGAIWSSLAVVQRDLTYIDRTAIAGEVAHYRVRAETVGGSSPWTSSVSCLVSGEETPYQRLRIWLRGDMGHADVAFTPGVLGSRWRDQSGRGNDGRLETGSVTTGATDAFAGRGVMQFPGSGYFRFPNCLTGLTTAEMLAVVRTRALPSTNNGWSQIGSAYNTRFPGSDGLWYEGFGLGGIQSANIARTPLTSPVLCSVSVTAGGWFAMRANGLLLKQVKAPVSLSWAGGGPVIGYGNAAFVGDVAEIMVFERVLTDDERWSMSRDLAVRFGVMPPPTAVPQLSAVLPRGTTSTECAWSYAGSDPVRVRLERSVDGATWVAVGEYQDDQTIIDHGLTPGGTYQYRARADGIGGVSAWSASVAVSMPMEPTAHDRLRLWLRADAGTDTLLGAAGGQGAIWRDQSGNGNDAVLESGSVTTATDMAFAGHKVMQFAGSSYLRAPNCLTGLTAAELIAVVRTRAPANTNNGWSQLGSAWSTRFPAADGQWYEGFGVSTMQSVSLSRIALTEPVLCSVSVAAAGTYTMRANGLVLRSTKAPANLAWSSGPVIGYGQAGFLGDIAEVMIFDRVLTDDERWSLSRDLTTRYLNRQPPMAVPSLSTPVARGNAAVECSWSYTGSDAVRIRIERSHDEVSWSLVDEYQDDRMFLDRSVAPGATYSYRARAEGLGGSSAWSAAVQIVMPTDATIFNMPRVWLRADLGTEFFVNGSGLVGSRWRDQSGNGHHAVIESGTAVLNDLAEFHDRRVMRFDNSGYFRLPNCLTGLTAGELIVVARSRAAPGVNNGWMQMGSAYQSRFPGSDGLWYESFGMGTHYDANVSRTPLTTPVLCSVSVVAGGDHVIRANGIELKRLKAPATLSWSTGPVIGNSSWNFTGDIAEVMVFPTVLSSDERREMYAYLNDRYLKTPLPNAVPSLSNPIPLSNRSVQCSWSYAGGDLVRIRVERSTDGASWVLVDEYQDDRVFCDLGLIPGETYRYRARAEGIGGVSDWSAAVSVSLPASAGVFDRPRVWLRADLGVEYFVNGIASVGARWRDLSGNGHHAVLVSGAPSLSVESDFFDQRVMRFDNSGYFRLPNCLTGMTAGELIVVARSRAAPGVNNGWMQMGSAYQSRFPGSDGLWYESFGMGTHYSANVSRTPLTAPVLCSVSVVAGGDHVIRANGLELNRLKAPVTLSWSAGPVIGNSSYNFTGDIAEIMVFPTELSSIERNAVYDYCVSRYVPGIKNLVATPYSHQITLHWDGWAMPARVVRRVPGGSWTTLTEQAIDRWYADDTAERGVTYEYQIIQGMMNQVVSSPIVTTSIPADWVIGLAELTVQPGDAMITEGTLPVVLDRGQVGVTRGNAVGWVVDMMGGAPAGAHLVQVTGGSGSFMIGDSVRFGSSDVDYQVIDVGLGAGNDLNLLVCQPGRPERGLLTAVSHQAAVVVSTAITTNRWSWSPSGDGTWQLLAEGPGERRRSLTGTDSDPWAYEDGSFSDRWGRPPGDYPIRLEVVSSAGITATTTLTAHIVRGQAPVARAELQETPGAGGPAAFFDARTSTDDHGIVEYWWDVDTSVDSDGNGLPADDRDLCGPTPSHLYATAGQRTVRLTVIDGAGQTAQTDLVCSVVADAAPVVAIVPFEGEIRRPIPAIVGRSTLLIGVVRDSGATTCRWDFGDGSSDPAVGEPMRSVPTHGQVEIEHTYALPPGTTVTVRLTARDAAGNESFMTQEVRIGTDTVQARTDEAIRRGLWYLHRQQIAGAPVGRWGASRPCDSAVVLHALSLHGHRPFGDGRRDPLATSAFQAMTWLWTQMLANTTYAGDTARSFSDANNRALDLVNDHQPYQVGMVMDAMVAALDASAPITATTAHLRGRRAIDVARDFQDIYAWGQSSVGGWQYTWRNGADNSACQWAAIGCLGLEQEYGLFAPSSTKTRTLAWVDSTKNIVGLYGYNSGTFYVNDASATTPSALIQLAWCGESRYDRDWMTTEQFMFNQHWQSYYKPNPHPDAYAMFALVKALRLARPQPITQLAGIFNWYDDAANGVRARLLGAQKTDGSWDDGRWLYAYGGGYPTRPTAWSLIMLSPSIFSRQRSYVGNRAPVAAAHPLVVPTAPGLATAVVAPAAVDAGSQDPDGDRLTLRLVPAGPYPVGVNAVTLIATDTLGVSSSASTTITVEDREAPRVTAPAAITIPTAPGVATAALTALGRATASDNVGVVSLTASGSTPSLPLGVHQVTWEARDAAGNRGTATQQVTVVDREPPTIAAPPPVVVWLPVGTDTATGVALGTPETSDNVAVASVTHDAPAGFAVGQHDVRWTVQDTSGNTASAVQRVDIRQGAAGPVAYLTSPGNGITFLAGSAIHLTAGVAYADAGDIERVEFLLDDALVAEDRTPPFAGIWPSAAAGEHRVRVRVRFRAQDHSPLPAETLSDEHTVHIVPADAVVGGQP